MSAEIILEAGIGETRALVLADDQPVAAYIERTTDAALLPGALWTVRISKSLAPQPRAIVRLGTEEALLEPVPQGFGEGRLLVVEITRMAMPEAGRPKLIKVKPHMDKTPLADVGVMRAGQTLSERLGAGGAKLRHLHAHEPDALEAHGWSEILEGAQSGVVSFAHGLLSIVQTPAMTVIDVDGAVEPATLLLRGAEAAARTIMLHNITGSIGIDLPTVGDKALRQEAAQIFDKIIAQPFERTAINGFGFLQLVRKRTHLSLPEILQSDRPAAAAHALLRRAERADVAGARALIAHPQIIAWLETHATLIDELNRRTGSHHVLRADPACRWEGGYVARA